MYYVVSIFVERTRLKSVNSFSLLGLWQIELESYRSRLHVRI